MPHAANSFVRECRPTYSVTFEAKEKLLLCPQVTHRTRRIIKGKMETKTLSHMFLALVTWMIFYLLLFISLQLNLNGNLAKFSVLTENHIPLHLSNITRNSTGSQTSDKKILLWMVQHELQPPAFQMQTTCLQGSYLYTHFFPELFSTFTTVIFIFISPVAQL